MSDESDHVSPPTAEPLLCDILHTIEMAKKMPDDCSMPLQEFFALVSLRASLTPQLPNRLCAWLQRAESASRPATIAHSRPATIAHSGHCRFMGVHCLHIQTSACRTAQDVASRSACAACACALHEHSSGSHCSKFNALTTSPIRPTHRFAVSYMARRATQAPRRGLQGSSPRRSWTRCASCMACCTSHACLVTTHVTIRCVHAHVPPKIILCPHTLNPSPARHRSPISRALAPCNTCTHS